ncbi:MAG: hypothetical protein PVI62_17470, partial [Desulfobacterales bacterium]
KKGTDAGRCHSRPAISRRWDCRTYPASSSPAYFYRTQPEPRPGLTAARAAGQDILTTAADAHSLLARVAGAT